MTKSEQHLEDIVKLLSTLIKKTEETNRILKDGVKSRWGHGMHVLEMEVDRFEKNEGKEKHF